MRIASVDPSLQPRDDITKGYLDFFDTCCGGYFAGSVTTLRNNTDCSFAGAVQSLRLTQANYVGHKPLPSVSLVSSNRGPGAPPADNSLNISVNPHKGKTCGHCGWINHVCETCFLWLKTPDGSKWAAKNPEKAAITRSLFYKFGKKRNGSSSGGASTNQKIGESWIVSEYILSASSCLLEKDVVLDIGATNHIFADRSYFTSLSAIKNVFILLLGIFLWSRVSVLSVLMLQTFLIVNGVELSPLTMFDTFLLVPRASSQVLSCIPMAMECTLLKMGCILFTERTIII